VASGVNGSTGATETGGERSDELTLKTLVGTAKNFLGLD
jgi:hypothetical protein